METKQAPKVRTCRVCGCTDYDCSGCFAKSGYPCWWVEEDLCSTCQLETNGQMQTTTQGGCFDAQNDKRSG